MLERKEPKSIKSNLNIKKHIHAYSIKFKDLSQFCRKYCWSLLVAANIALYFILYVLIVLTNNKCFS